MLPQDEGRGGHWYLLQGIEATLVETDPIHHDEIRLLRKDRCRTLHLCRPQATRSVLKGKSFFALYWKLSGRKPEQF